MIRIGTSSWADPGFVRDWYPPRLPASARLSWYAEHFDYVEVNSSFYAIPAGKVVQRWDAQTPAGFLFDVKLHRLLSRHAAPAETLPPDLRKAAQLDSRGNVVLTPEIELVVAERFRAEIAPLREAGKLGALLLQLTPAFSPRRHELSELAHLIQLFAADRLAVELRNRDWLVGPRRDAVCSFFREANVPLVLVDAPASEHFTVMPSEDVITSPSLVYLRLHGRNERGYIAGRSVAERFDYEYTSEDLAGVAERVRGLAGQAAELHVAFNNNRSHYAPTAALKLKTLMGR